MKKREGWQKLDVKKCKNKFWKHCQRQRKLSEASCVSLPRFSILFASYQNKVFCTGGPADEGQLLHQCCCHCTVTYQIFALAPSSNDDPQTCRPVKASSFDLAKAKILLLLSVPFLLSLLLIYHHFIYQVARMWPRCRTKKWWWINQSNKINPYRKLSQ